MDVKSLNFLQNITDIGVLEYRYAHQYQDTEDGRKQHESDLIGQLGDLLVEKSENTYQRDNTDKHRHCFHVVISPF
jgi:hypothetical protein